MAKFHFLLGDQVAYIPHHAHNISHRAVQFGFITSINYETDTAFVRFWSGTERTLRTKDNSEAIPIDRLVPYLSVFYSELAEAVLKYVLPNAPVHVHGEIRENMYALRKALSGGRW